MIDKETYEKMKETYGKYSSWAVWADADVIDDPKSKVNVGNLKVFNNPDILKVLNTGYVFVGLNVSGSGGEFGDEDLEQEDDWKNFHSPNGKHNDFKIRYALKGTRYWGSYMTDIIKKLAITKSDEVMKYLDENPEFLKKILSYSKKKLTF